MKRWRTWQIALFAALCILLNYGGRRLADHFDLPLWLDSLGTALCAYAGGPVCGAIVGVTSNVIYGTLNHYSYIYALTGLTLGVIVGFGARRRRTDTLFGTMALAAMATVAAVLISAPLNMLFHQGGTGNLWGDGVIGYLREHNIPFVVRAALGQFYIDFLDKTLTLLALYALLKLARLWRGRGAKGEGAREAQKLVCLLAALALLGAPVGAGMGTARAEAATASERDFNDYVQTVFSSDNGLPCGEANDIAQTNDGILWIGTYAGLYRYNGSEFQWMDDYESVRNVNCLYVDEEGRLWIGTNDNGLSICIDEHVVNVVDASRGLPSNSVRAIIRDTNGYYYIGTTSSMQILTLNNGLKQVNTLSEINYADDIAADRAGHVATLTSDGRLFLMYKGQILSSIQLTDDREDFNSVCFDDDGYLLVGTSTKHLYVFDISRDRFDEIVVRTLGDMNHINDLYCLENGELFVSADNGVGFISQDEEFEAVNTGDFNNSIDNMLVDYQGNLWFTSSRLGLLRMAPSAFKDVYSAVGMPNRVVNAVEKWQGCYYFGTDKGLDAVDEACRTRVTNALTREMDGVRIRCLKVDSSNHLWICTYGSGLLEVEPDGTKHLYNSDNGSFGSRARVVTELSDGTIMAGGDTGISFIRDHGIVGTIGYAEGLINSMILTVTELSDGRILAGTDGDGIAVLRGGAVESMITRDDGLSSEVILRTVKDAQSDGVFIVTSNGLCYMDEDGSVRALDNFPYFNNYDVWARDDDMLFVMSSAGIYVVDRDELLSGRADLGYELLNSRRGLSSALTANSWNYCDASGDLFLPCDRGVFIIDSASYASLTSAYRMSVNAVKLDGALHRVERDTVIDIGRGVSRVELFPEVINYTIQDPCVGYRLEGFDSDWTLTPQSALGTIVYTNLPTGDYTFHLAVFDSSQENILEEREYRLTKAKEIYDNQWFRVYMLAIPMLAVAWLTWFVAGTRSRRMVERQEREMALAQQQIQMGKETIIAIAKAVDAKDERTSQHSARVSLYSVMLAREMGFSDSELENLRRAALMHDIGKIGIPDSILNKPARLTDEEYAVMKTHVTRGAAILKDFTLIDHVVEGARYHHERYDGRGYPDGLKGEDIPLYGRIIGVADAFDAMTANRVYRKQMDFEYVLGELHKGRGTQFDPQIVDIMLRLIDEGKIDLRALYPAKQDDANQSAGERQA